MQTQIQNNLSDPLHRYTLHYVLVIHNVTCVLKFEWHPKKKIDAGLTFRLRTVSTTLQLPYIILKCYYVQYDKGHVMVAHLLYVSKMNRLRRIGTLI
mgnify:CR=1 FL=1